MFSFPPPPPTPQDDVKTLLGGALSFTGLSCGFGLFHVGFSLPVALAVPVPEKLGLMRLHVTNLFRCWEGEHSRIAFFDMCF